MSNFNNNPKKNADGYSDPTAYKALKNIDEATRDPERAKFKKTLGCILRICELAGYKLESQIVLTDMRTGRTWR